MSIISLMNKLASLASRIKQISPLALVVFSYLMLAGNVLAGPTSTPVPIGKIGTPLILPDIPFGTFLSGIISLIIIVAFIAAFVFLLWGGFQWITSGGDEAGIAAARGRIMQALVGLTVVVAAWAIFQLVQVAFGVTVLGADLDDLFRRAFGRTT